MSRLDNFEKYLERTRKNTPAENFESYANKVNSAGTSRSPSKGESLEEYVARREREQEKINAKRARVEAEKVDNKQSEALEWQRQMAEKRAKNQNTSAKTEYASPSQLGGTLKETTITPNTTTSAEKDTAPAGEVLKKLAAERLRNYAIGHGTIATPRSEAEIQADIDKFENENGFAGRLKSALGEAKNLLSGNIDEVYDTAKERQKKTQTLSDLYAERDAAVLAEFEKLRSNPDFVNNSGYDSAYVRGTKATGNYEKNDSVQRYDFINGVDMSGTHYEYPNDFGAANQDVKNIFSPVLEGYSGVPVHLRTINDSERHLYNYIYKTQGAEAADKYIDALDDTLAARYRGEVTSGAKETASEHPVLSSAATVLTIPARAAAFTGQAADYMEDGRLKNNAPYNAAAYTGSAIREQVGKDIEKNVGGFGGKVASFGYGLAMSMADSLATLPYGQQLAPLVLGSTAAADTVIASKDKGLSDGQAIMLGAVSAAAEALTEKYSVEALLDKTVLGKEGAKRYIAKNIITEASEETASEIANLAADILISKGKSEWQQSINEYKKQGMTEGQAFGKAFLDQLLNVGLSALGGALSGGVMAGASAATDAAVKKAVNHAFKKNQGASYARRDTFDGVLHETAEPEVAEDVSDRDYRVINDLSTLASHVENDEDINSVLTLLETTIDSAQNNTGVFDDVEFITKQAERIADTLKANGNDIVRGNTTKKSLVAEAYNAPVSELPARLASLVEEVASETEPGNNAINATIDYLRGEIQERGRRVSLATTPEGKRISEIERRVLMELDKTLRSRREEIENIVNAEPKQELAVAEAPVMTSLADMTENTAESLTESPVADTTRETTESPAAEPEVKRDFTLTHEQTKHTKTGEPLEVFRTSGTLSKEEYAALKSKMKEIGGFYSKFVKGFIVPADQVSAVSEFANVAGENTNRAVGETETIVGETQTDVVENNVFEVNESGSTPAKSEGAATLTFPDGVTSSDRVALKRAFKKWADNEQVYITDMNSDRAHLFASFASKLYKAGYNGVKPVLNYAGLTEAEMTEFPAFLNDTFYQLGKDAAAKKVTNTVDVSDTAERSDEHQAMAEGVPAETAEENHNRKGESNDERSVETEDRPDVQGLRLAVEETAETPDGVQEESEPTGGDRGDDGGRVSRTSDGDSDGGIRVRDGESDTSGESDAGADERDDSAGTGGSGTDADDVGPGREPVDKPSAPKKKTRNFSFGEEIRKYINGTRPRTRDNIEAIKTLFQIERENRQATAAEKEILAKYKGWGGLSEAFANYMTNKELRELLSQEEYDAARRSTQNAHYTSLEVIEAMYKGLERMGFTGGNLLEPSMGTGNFFGMLPKKLANKTNLYGVEMDNITGRIARALYGDADITIAPYQDVNYADGSFDAAVGNVPFSSTTYTYNGEKHMLHDYFFVKTLDKVKDGGVVMFITSTGTLDKANPKTRDAIAKQADLVAAFRLPSNAFKTNAGTEVTTDIVVLRKRHAGVPRSGETFFSVGEIDGIPINEYFVRHPENILGTLVSEKGMYANERTQVRADERDYSKALSDAMNSLPKNILNTDMAETSVKVETDTQKSRFLESDGGVSFYDSTTRTVTKLTGKKADKAKHFMRLKDAYNGVINIATNPNTSLAEREKARENLGEIYDSFVKEYGKLNSRTVKSDLRGDSEYWMVSALEKKGKTPGTYTKSDIFTEDLYTRGVPKHVDSAHDALAVSLSTRGAVDLDYMAKLTGQPKDAVSAALSDVIVETPDGDWQLTALYLSGNVREKLAEAERAAENNPKFAHNAEILRAALPRQLSAEEITPKLGASWIDKAYYEEFARSVFGVKPKLSYNNTTGTWEYEYLPYANSAKYGSDGLKLLVPTMNQKQITVRVDGKVDLQATAQQRQRQEMLKEDFNAWIFGTSERRTALENKFNRLFASWKGADFNSVGSYLSLDGVNPDIKLREYQKGAVARVVFGGDTLLAHGVGTGKTFEMIASAMECKRLGITHKNLFVVPNNKVTDFQSDIHKLYPGAKVMAVTEADFTKDRRAAMISALAANDYDIAVIGHSQFGFIPVSAETKRNALRAQIDEIEATVNGMDARQDRRTIKQLEKSKESLEKKLKELATRKDDTVNFESLGIDGLFVDEAHNFKALSYYTKLNVAGAKAGGASQRAQDMFEKTQYLHDIHGRVVFGTATPITNSVAEIYNMTRFVAPDALTEAGIESFDAWSANFGNIESKVEISPDGISFRAKERYSKFSNVNAMIGMFRRFADILRSNEVLKDLPKAERVTVECESNDHLEGYLNEIQHRVDSLRGMATKNDNMLLVTNDGRAAAIDLRLVAKQLGVPASELDLDGSKINRTVENVVEEYKGSSKNKGTQLVFLDYGMDNDPEKRYGVDLYSDIIRKLIAQGIPANEIVRLDKVDNKKLDELYEKVNSGEVRVLIGSTARMGEGLNVQKRLVALHHLNPPYRPSDIEQREGRIIRFGNQNKDVRIYRYVQKRSFDSYMWQMLERKQIMINQAMSGGDTNEIDDVDEFVLSAAEAKALASGNPLLLEKSELDDRFSKLSTARSVFMRSIYNAQDIIASYPGFIRNLKSNIEGVQKNAEIINAHPFTNDFDIVLRGKSYTDRKAANELLTKILSDGRYSVNKTYEIGSVRGMKLSFMQEGQRITLYLDGAKRIEFESGADNAARIVNALNKAGNPKAQLDSMHNHLAQLEKALSDAKELVGSTFPQQTEYDEVLARLNEVNRLMNEAAGVKAGGEIIDDEGMSEDFGGEDVDDDTSSRSRQRPGTSQSRIEGKWGKGDKNGKKLKSVSDLKNEAERLFGVSINVGKVEGGKNVRGIYKTHANTIRTRVYGDLPTIAHELGHYFERKYNLSYSTAVDELIEVYHDLLEDAVYNESLYPFEAIANYFAELMYDAKAARESAPEFAEYLDSVMSVADKKKLDEYVRMTNEYHAADLRRRREAQLKYRTKENSWHRRAQLQLEDFTENPAAYSGRLSDGFVRNWIDDIVDLKPFGKTYDLAMRERTAGSIIDGRLNIAFTDNSGNIIGKSLAAILAEGNITQLNHEAFDNYLIQRIALDRIEAAERGETEATMVYVDPELQNKDNIIKAIEDYETENPTFKDAAKGIYEYRHNLLSIAVDAGVVSAELADYLERTYPHYVPLNRVMDDKSKASSGKSGKVQGSPIKSFKGSGRAIYSPIENLMLQTASFSNAVLQNQVRQEFADYIDSHEDMGWAAEKVEPDKYFDTVSTNPIYHRLMRFQSEDLNSLTDEQKQNLFDDVMDYIGDGVGMWKVAPRQDEKIITVLRNGQREYYEMHDEHVMDALNTLDRKQSHILIEAVGKATGWFKVLTTGNNPEFGFTNIPRDVQSGFVSSTTTNNPFKYFGDYFAAFGQAVVNSKGYKEYLRNGGGFQGSYTADIGRLKQKYSGVIKNPRKLSRILHGAVSLYTHMLDAGESASRYAEYKRARKLGIDALEAMRKSQEITVNFSRHGKASKELDKVIPYFNATVQSIYHMYDVLFHGEKKTAAWVKFVSGSVVPSALMLAWNYILAPIAYSDDEEEEKILKSVDTLSTYNKNAYWCFYAGDGKFIRIAKPKDMTVFSTVITNMFELYVRENPAAFYDYGAYLLETLVPPHSLDDFMIFGTKASLDKNETFTGSPIVPTAYQGLTPEMQYNENTSRLAIAVGSALNISPMKIDFVIDDLGGFVGDVMLSLTSQKSGAEIAKETFGLSDVISADSVYSNNIASLFYDAKEEYESSAKSYPKGHEKYDAYASYGAYKYGKIADLYSDVNKLIKKHPDSDATRAARDTLNTLIDSVNRTSATEIDRAVSEIAEITGEKVADIAPYIAVPTSLKDKDKNEYILGPYDLMEYYLESQAYLEAWYYDILTSGYDAETIVDAMKAAKKEVKKTVDAHYLEVMQNYFQ
jgi:N12 class adenine-specific DNA methylase